MTRRREAAAGGRLALPAPPELGDGCEQQLAQELIALHRAERAPLAVVQQVESRLAGGGKPLSFRAAWARRLDAFLAPLAGWPVAGVVALVPLLLLTWQSQRLEAERRQLAEVATLQAEERSRKLANQEVTVSGVAVPGSLQWRIYGDEIGMGHCEGRFLLELGGLREAPVRVHWTRCDLPEALSGELRRVFSPLQGAVPFPVSVRGYWARVGEFEALGLRLEP